MLKTFIIKCSVCGVEVERSTNQPDGTCFGCKMERKRGHARTLYKSKEPVRIALREARMALRERKLAKAIQLREEKARLRIAKSMISLKKYHQYPKYYVYDEETKTSREEGRFEYDSREILSSQEKV